MSDRTIKVTDYFGGCPTCGQNDGFLNIGQGHWFVCHPHRIKWLIGGNLFDCWKEETEADWRANFERINEYAESGSLSQGVWPADPDLREKEIIKRRATRERWQTLLHRIDCTTKEVLASGAEVEDAITEVLEKACTEVEDDDIVDPIPF